MIWVREGNEELEWGAEIKYRVGEDNVVMRRLVIIAVLRNSLGFKWDTEFGWIEGIKRGGDGSVVSKYGIKGYIWSGLLVIVDSLALWLCYDCVMIVLWLALNENGSGLVDFEFGEAYKGPWRMRLN